MKERDREGPSRATGAAGNGQDGGRGAGGHPVLHTGVRCLDDILGGGLPAEQLYLIEGKPGTGKTTLSLQFLLEGAARGERGLYVTLSETAQELSIVADAHGWDFENVSILDMDLLPNLAASEAQYTVFHPSEVELQDSIATILNRVEEAQPARVVLDSISEIRLLARDPLRFRRQILALKAFFAARNITAFIIDDRGSDEPEMQLHSLAHGVIRLEQIPLSHGGERRQIRVPKLRGVRFHAGYHDYVIRKGGIDVFPRIRFDERTPRAATDGARSSGSTEIDAMLGGGFTRGSSVLLTGAPGTGKSVLSTQFAVAAAERGERVAIYLFDERLGTFLTRARNLDMPLDDHVRSGAIRITPLEPTEISPGEFTNRILRTVHEDDVSAVVVDSLNGFTNAMVEESQLTVKVHELLSYLGNQGVTTLITLAQRGMFGAPPDNTTDVSYLSDTVVLLRYFEAQGAVRRAMSIVKQRTNDHERTIREFQVGSGGLQVGRPLEDFQGVLTGVPTFTGRTAALMEAVDELPA